jgi:hypothetical protein
MLPWRQPWPGRRGVIIWPSTRDSSGASAPAGPCSPGEWYPRIELESDALGGLTEWERAQAEHWGRLGVEVTLRCGGCARHGRPGRILACGFLVHRRWRSGSEPRPGLDWRGVQRVINIGADRVIAKETPQPVYYDGAGEPLPNKLRPGRRFLDARPLHTFRCVESCGAQWTVREPQEIRAILLKLGLPSTAGDPNEVAKIELTFGQDIEPA